MLGIHSDRSLYACVARCQWIAGHLSDAHPRGLLSEIRQLAADVPENTGMVDQWLLRSLLGQALGRVLRTHDLAPSPAIAQAFVAFASAGLTPGRWQREFVRLLDCSAAVLDTVTAHDPIPHGPVERALRVIDARFADADLHLNAIADDVGMSSSHLSRLLKTHTGHGFVLHVHQRRVSAARRLLTGSSLSVKEVAASVGYRSVTQLDRQFKRFCGFTPVSTRSRRISINARAS